MSFNVNKSASVESKRIIIPAFSEKTIVEDLEPENLEKPFEFAHVFDVSITPENSGSWILHEGFRIWQVTIESAGAFSINLVFEKFHLPPGARLFVFNEDKSFVLGAFTHQNNQVHKKLGVYPVPGQSIVVQYEEPETVLFKGELMIGKVAHGYKDVFTALNRWDRRFSGSCNVNVNCEFESGLDKEKRSVMRIFATKLLGTGTLINNLKNDGKPYVVSALHVFLDPSNAETAVFDFNYESAFCTNLEGSDIQTISGASAVATFDSLDMIMVELSETPPASYRPYWAGWNARPVPPAKTWTIHHPNGDTKKISHDEGIGDSARYSSEYIKNGSWKISNWESGTTENGSSGAGLFLGNGQITGVLQGGQASCAKPLYDLFTRFDKLYQYRKEANKQFKFWLDPENTGLTECDGFDFYNGQSQDCVSVSNFLSTDVHETISDTSQNLQKSWLTGNNSSGITEVAERFSGFESCFISGVSVGIARKFAQSSKSEMVVKIYLGDTIPRFEQGQYRFMYRNLIANAVNYLDFGEQLHLEGNFFISFVIPTEGDTLVFYHSKSRPVVLENTIGFLKDDKWMNSAKVLNQPLANMALLVQPNICSLVYAQKKDTVTEKTPFISAYPVPTNGILKVEFKQHQHWVNLSVFDLMGRKVYEQRVENSIYGILDLSKLIPGYYFLYAVGPDESKGQKIIVVAQ